VQQDTAGLQTSDGITSYITRALTLDGRGTAAPPAIDLFGVFVAASPPTSGAAGGLITGAAAAASSQISLTATLTASPYRQLYRFNSCVIGGTSCGVTLPTLAALPVQQAPLDKANPFFVDFAADEDFSLELNFPFSYGGVTNTPRPVPFGGMWDDGLASPGEQDIEDPTITGAPNEEIWRRPEDGPAPTAKQPCAGNPPGAGSAEHAAGECARSGF
jgi:hypothetical protein